MSSPNLDFSWLEAALSSAATGVVTYLFARRKNKAEAAASEIDNVEKAVAIWRGIASDLEGRFTVLQQEVLELRKQLLKLQLENTRLSDSNDELKQQCAELQSEIDVLNERLKSATK